MKKIALLAVVASVVFLAGCSSKKQAASATATPAAQATQAISIDPTLSQDGFVRVQLTDPALYNYLQNQGKSTVSSDTGTTSSDEQKKIGRTVAFQKAFKYGISGSASVVSASKIKVGQFTYNGGCGPITIGLIINNNPTQPLATVKEISAAVSSSQFDIEIPSNLSLTKFDSLAVFCSDSADPVSTADFSGF